MVVNIHLNRYRGLFQLFYHHRRDRDVGMAMTITAELAEIVERLENIAGPIRIGDRVRCFVYVGRERIPMHVGIVTEVRDGYYMVDRMSLHGGAPWIEAERWVEWEPKP